MAYAAPAQSRTTAAPRFALAAMNPLPGASGITVFVALALSGAIVDLAVCWRFMNLGDFPKTMLLAVFTLFLTGGWLAFSMADDVESFLRTAAKIVVLYTPVVAMILTGSGVLFWVTLIIMVAMAVGTTLEQVQKASVWEKLIYSIYVSWVVTGIIVTLGSGWFFGYAESSPTLSKVHFLLDARYVITALLVLSAFGNALFKAFEEGLPKIPSPPRFPSWDLTTKPDSPLRLVMRPFVVVANLFVLIAQSLTNLVWQLVGFIVAYLYRTGRNLANQFYSLVTDKTLLRAIARIVLTFFVVSMLAVLARMIAPDLVLYLTASTSPFSLSLEIISAMVRMFALAVALVATVVFLSWLWNPSKKGRDQAAFGGSMILVALALSSTLLYVLSKTGVLDLVGFSSIGILSLILVLLLGSVFLFQIASLVTGQQKKT